MYAPAYVSHQGLTIIKNRVSQSKKVRKSSHECPDPHVPPIGYPLSFIETELPDNFKLPQN